MVYGHPGFSAFRGLGTRTPGGKAQTLLPNFRALTVPAAILFIALQTRSATAEVPGQPLSTAVHEVLPAVVAISADRVSSGGTEHIYGSGFVIDPGGLILTNKHVIEGDTNITVMFS